MKIKKGDKIKMLSGKDRGKTGKVLQVFPKEKRASVEGLNILIKHMRPRRQGESGQRIEFPAPFNISNAALVCPNCGKTVRVNYKEININKEGEKKIVKKARVCNKCKQVIS